ncbi:MAG: hybrid sensor histidine kinase/response regulator [Anaerolineae bacterium]|nr:hybrid sensor histidine kinase/response regulator [Anaerolineae bacterium]
MEQTRKTKVLYIEDDPASRMLVERALRFAGYDVLIAERGLEGIDLARREHPDLILTDINLPDLSGREVTTVLRNETSFANTPIVALTAQTQNEQRDMAMVAGVSGYLTKPIDIEALPGQIEHYLHGARDNNLDTTSLAAARTRYMRELVGRLEGRIRELETFNESLLHLDKMKDIFIQLTAHELRTPLTLVYGYSRLLQDNPQVKFLIQENADTLALMQGMNDAIVRMQKIINEILTMSRIITNQIDLAIGMMDLGRIAQQVVNQFQQALTERHLHLVFDPSEWPQRMQADWELMQLALTNLLSNAIKYTPDGGTITLRASADENRVRLSIKDTGIGIAPEAQVTIFERFQTTHNVQLHSTSKTAYRGGGIGLGLAICKGIIEAHGGRIWVESPGLDEQRLPGSEFIIEMPLVAQSRAAL